MATPRIAIIGAGVCGIGAAARLARAGIRSFQIFDSATRVGGTWNQNHYPGASVDVPSILYQYSFKNHHWRRTHATQVELLAYLEEVVADYGLARHLRLGTAVEQVAWDDGLNCYWLTTASGETQEFDIVVSAVGFLDVPNMPTWPGLEDFVGDVFHTAAWDHKVDLRGKRVAVVGVGSSATQVVPAIQPEVEHIYVFQREPGWVLPRMSHTYTPEELSHLAAPWRRKLERLKMIISYERSYVGGPVYVAGSKRNLEAECASREYIKEVFKDRPGLREAVTPSYVFSGKRRILSDDYYPSLLNDNVQLIACPVASATEKGIVDASGDEYAVDVIIIATGFTAWRYLAKLRVIGRSGIELHDVWDKGAFALNGMTVPGFPNFYMLYGPNTNGAGAISAHWIAEQGAIRILRDITRMRRNRYAFIDTRKSVTALYNHWLQQRLRATAWSQANNYMRAESGKIVTQFHGSMTLRWLLLHVLQPLGTYGIRSNGSTRSYR